ncbi:unnamed protein product [Soboliphyme baturini]|uniref:Calponin-homology (CH) domain-containing protein n=1 Tax=Soboliphyme baturini TaxID=241478 RepID=A0A183J7P5_9BILA|nr:unnamed protein product [Soboliphyme baturini]
MLLSVRPVWLRIGLESIFSETIPHGNNVSDVRVLVRFILLRVFSDPALARQYSFKNIIHYQKQGFSTAIGKHFLYRFLTLFIFLDFATAADILSFRYSLFKPKSSFESVKDLLTALAKEFISPQRDMLKELSRIDYTPRYEQSWLHEYKVTVSNLTEDFRDGVILTRLAEILQRDWSLECELWGPPISRLQKLHNVSVSVKSLAAYGIVVSDVSCPKLVAGDEQEIVKVLQRLAIRNLTVTTDPFEIQRELVNLRILLRKSTSKAGEKLLASHMPPDTLLLAYWCATVLAFFDIEFDPDIRNIDEPILLRVISFYVPNMIPDGMIKDGPSLNSACLQEPTTSGRQLFVGNRLYYRKLLTNVVRDCKICCLASDYVYFEVISVCFTGFEAWNFEKAISQNLHNKK